MALLTEENRRGKAATLQAYLNQGTNAINQLKAIQAQLVSLKTTVNQDADFGTTDEDDVQSVIDTLVTEIATI